MDDDRQNQLAPHRRRALYRAHHRGTKELDFVLGRFAAAHVPTMAEHELHLFERFLALPDPDLQRWFFDSRSLPDDAYADLLDQIRAFHGLSR